MGTLNLQGALLAFVQKNKANCPCFLDIMQSVGLPSALRYGQVACWLVSD